MTNIIKVRAHHLMCIPRFYRGGYNIKGFKKICYKIRKNPNIKIKIIKDLDDICNECPNNKGKFCITPKFNAYVISFDDDVLKKLKLKENSIHKAKDILNWVMKIITKKDIRDLCEGCPSIKSCLKWGINKSFEKDLNKND